jgi:hypothetical protein
MLYVLLLQLVTKATLEHKGQLEHKELLGQLEPKGLPILVLKEQREHKEEQVVMVLKGQ